MRKANFEKIVNDYQHKERMRLFNESYRKLAENKEAWREEQNERKILEGTLADGLEEEDFQI